jgi:hypothetical protein
MPDREIKINRKLDILCNYLVNTVNLGPIINKHFYLIKINMTFYCSVRPPHAHLFHGAIKYSAGAKRAAFSVVYAYAIPIGIIFQIHWVVKNS